MKNTCWEWELWVWENQKHTEPSKQTEEGGTDVEKYNVNPIGWKNNFNERKVKWNS